MTDAKAMSAFLHYLLDTESLIGSNLRSALRLARISGAPLGYPNLDARLLEAHTCVLAIQDAAAPLRAL